MFSLHNELFSRKRRTQIVNQVGVLLNTASQLHPSHLLHHPSLLARKHQANRVSLKELEDMPVALCKRNISISSSDHPCSLVLQMTIRWIPLPFPRVTASVVDQMFQL